MLADLLSLSLERSITPLLPSRVRIIFKMVSSASTQVATGFLAFALLLSSCAIQVTGNVTEPSATASPSPTEAVLTSTPLPTRPPYDPGQLVDYMAQPGDTLLALAARFNTSIAEILEANPIIPPDVTTLPPGLPMSIPIYYRAYWGSLYKSFP